RDDDGRAGEFFQDVDADADPAADLTEIPGADGDIGGAARFDQALSCRDIAVQVAEEEEVHGITGGTLHVPRFEGSLRQPGRRGPELTQMAQGAGRGQAPNPARGDAVTPHVDIRKRERSAPGE